jgi:hypothetical protein
VCSELQQSLSRPGTSDDARPPSRGLSLVEKKKLQWEEERRAASRGFR